MKGLRVAVEMRDLLRVPIFRMHDEYLPLIIDLGQERELAAVVRPCNALNFGAGGACELARSTIGLFDECVLTTIGVVRRPGDPAAIGRNCHTIERLRAFELFERLIERGSG